MKNKGANRIHRRKPAKKLKLSQLQQIWYSMDAKCSLVPYLGHKKKGQRSASGGFDIMEFFKQLVKAGN